jgi:hypothetical protein
MYRIWLIPYTTKKGVMMMGKDRQEKKLKQSKRVESDRDRGTRFKGATRLDTPHEARRDNQ